MTINVLIYIPSNGGGYTDAISGEYYKPGEIAGFDSAVTAELAEANRIISAGAGLDVSELVTALIQIAWSNITGKPSSFTPAAHTHTAADVVSGQFANARISAGSVTQHQAALALTIAQIAGLQAALDARVLSSEKGAANGVATLDANTLLPLALIPNLSADQTTSGTFDAARIPELDWSKIIEATRPDTLAGYGITDALTATEVGQQIQAAINALVGGAPGALDTLNELAAALGDDPNAITTLTNAVASKLDASVWQAATAAVDGYMSKEDKAKLDGIEAGATGDMTGAEIKSAYEGEANTNAFTDAEKSKLGGIAAQATKNATDAALRDRSTHTGTQPQSSIDDLEADLADRLLRSELPYASLVHYSSTDDATDMAAGATVQWDSALMTDSGISVGGAGNTNITVSEAGKYIVSVRLVYADTSVEGVDVNNTLGVSILVNGVSVGRQGVGSPVVNDAGANEGQVTLSEPLNLEPGDVVTVATQRLSGGDELYLIAGQSSLIVERKGGKSAALAAQRFSELSDTPNDYTAEGAILRVKTGGGIEYTLTLPISSVADLAATLSSKADLVGGKIPTSQIPAVSLTEVHAVADTAARDALTVQEGDVAVVASESKSYIYDGSEWLEINAAAPVQSVNGQTGVVVLTKSDIGLGNVDNTPDADKPISTAQAAVNAKQSGALSILTANTNLDTSEARRANPIYVASALTLTVPAPVARWSQPVFVGRGITATFDFRVGETDETTVRDSDGNAFDLTAPNNQIEGPAYLELVSRTASEVEIWT
jgi:hypothetical protein